MEIYIKEACIKNVYMPKNKIHILGSLTIYISICANYGKINTKLEYFANIINSKIFYCSLKIC